MEPGTVNQRSIGTLKARSRDLGHGGAALAVRVNGSDVDLYFGVLARHAHRGTFPGPLDDQGVLTGGIGKFRYTESSGAGNLAELAWVDLEPSSGGLAGSRGGYGVMGMTIGDIVGTTDEELVVSTLAGDLFVFDLSTFPSAPVYRTWVPGGLGLYNSMVIADLDGVAPGPELQVASSLGIRKWRRP
jgi:hypothetical protein